MNLKSCQYVSLTACSALTHLQLPDILLAVLPADQIPTACLRVQWRGAMNILFQLFVTIGMPQGFG